MARLRRVSPQMKGWTRRRAGKGFAYLDGDGNRLPAEEVERIRSLAIPPAWVDVWICPWPNGHIQAIGTDAAGRRQYLYHPDWRTKRDELKFDRVKVAGTRLAKARERIIGDLRAEGMPLARAAATATRLLDLGYFRSAATPTPTRTACSRPRAPARAAPGQGPRLQLRRQVRHRALDHDQRHPRHRVAQPHAATAGWSTRLLAYKGEARWADLDAAAVNAYIAEMVAEDLTAKDFRTWHATVLAVALAESDEKGTTKASQKRAVKAAVEEVAAYLGNTPTIARKSYIDPRVIDQYEAGTTIAPTLAKHYRDDSARQAAIEKAVGRLIDGAD